MTSTACLKTTVKNTSGFTRHFAFLPPHGVTLDAGEEYTLHGDPLEAIRSNSIITVAADRELSAFETALLDGSLEIVNTPNPVLYDPTRDETMMLKLDNGYLFAASPCWVSSGSSSSYLGTPQGQEPAATELLRPTGNINTLWTVYDYTNIDDVVVQPDTPGADEVMATDSDSGEEQAWQLAIPAGSGKVYRIRLWLDGRLVYTDEAFTCRLKVNGSFTATNTFQYADVMQDDYEWVSHDFIGVWEAGGLDVELYVTPENVAAYKVYPSIRAAYVEINP